MAKKILVTDDEPQITNTLASRLNRKGYEVITAFDGKTCISKALSEDPDVILLDIMMPDIDGFSVCKLLKQDRKTKNIPIIMLTALGQEKDLSKGLEEGACCFISKPYNFNDLLCEIETVLKNKPSSDFS